MKRLPCLTLAAPLALATLPTPATAHPHIFVDTGIELIMGDDGQVAALKITWIYDELFSLLMLEDLGLDDDYDGVLRPDELTALQGFDMVWPDGFDGDVHLTAADAPVALGPPSQATAALQENGMLISTHIRHLEHAIDPRVTQVLVRPYDPSFYTAYSVEVALVGTDLPGCTTEVFTPDLDAAYAQLEAALAELSGGSILFSDGSELQEIEFPPVGDRFSEEVRLTCNDGS